MRILILGGTKFLGRHLVEAALEAGHEVTLFNRGQTGNALFPQVEQLRGDRDGNLGALRGRRWDLAIDPSGYVPRIVRTSAQLLADAVAHYTFISSISVYADLSAPDADETTPVGTLEDETVENIDGGTYGPLKALCEQTVSEVFSERALLVRPGLIVGPHDPTDRFTYWPWRIAQGGEVLAPGVPRQAVQFIDVRDLAAWILAMSVRRQSGTYNATGPDYPLSMEQTLLTCREVSGSDATLTWVNESFLLERGVEPYTDLPLWVPAAENGHSQVNCARAIAQGLRFRSLDETIADTLDWEATRPRSESLRAGLSPERERKLLKEWRREEDKLQG